MQNWNGKGKEKLVRAEVAVKTVFGLLINNRRTNQKRDGEISFRIHINSQLSGALGKVKLALGKTS